jgi:hypothetical protein
MPGEILKGRYFEGKEGYLCRLKPGSKPSDSCFPPPEGSAGDQAFVRLDTHAR